MDSIGEVHMRLRKSKIQIAIVDIVTATFAFACHRSNCPFVGTISFDIIKPVCWVL